MTAHLQALVVAAREPTVLVGFWAALLGWEPAGDDRVLRPGGGPGLRFAPTGTAKRAQNHAHLDLTSTSRADQERTVARVLGLGGRHVDVGQGPEETHVVLGDPEGNELCVIAPGNDFLAGCGQVGAVACDGTEAVGRFWSRAWAWPLVWDQDEETAVQAPTGGTKITWGGYPPSTDPQRVRFEVATADDLEREAARLVALGATPAGADERGLLLADPDARVFHLVAG